MLRAARSTRTRCPTWRSTGFDDLWNDDMLGSFPCWRERRRATPS
jgi:hypothetical protein